jgi:hypothetical protein
MLIGFFLRRFVTVTLCAAAFWAGVKADSLFASGLVAGGDCTSLAAP